MSRLYDALRRVESQGRQLGERGLDSNKPSEILRHITGGFDIQAADSVKTNASSASRLVALLEPKSLGAEKFRSLATRLEHLRSQREMKTLQITSAVISEGKSVVAANLAVTFSTYAKSNVLLIEGDLHRPALTSMLGLNKIGGLGDWWRDPGDKPIIKFIHRLDEMQLWFLSAGTSCNSPSDLLQSERFAGALRSLAERYDWVVVDSTPLLPIVDANLWSRLIDGTILVVREKKTPIQALRQGLENLDSPKLVGIVLNDASEFDHGDYHSAYYGTQ